MKKKVLFIIDSLTCGGAEKSLVSLLPLLNRDKYEISLWMLTPTGPFISLLPKDIHIIAQPSYNRWEQLKADFQTNTHAYPRMLFRNPIHYIMAQRAHCLLYELSKTQYKYKALTDDVNEAIF